MGFFLRMRCNINRRQLGGPPPDPVPQSVTPRGSRCAVIRGNALALAILS
ncbi:MAG: hypothetical protein RLZZ127_2518 [Planctomycetota bacterium]|jgi:hypothetical protein